MSRPRYAINKNKYLLEPEVAALNAVLEKFKDTDSRNCTLIWFLLHTGARASEALGLTAADLNHHDETVLIKGLKGSDDREIPLPSWLFNRVAVLARENQQVFPITYIRLHQIWGVYRPVQKKLHSLRHTFAISLYKKRKDLRLVQVALGHRNITNTMVYADYIYTQEEFRKAIVA